MLGITGEAARWPFRNGIRMTEALALAGGVTIASDFEDIRLVRGPLKNPKIYQFDLEALVAGEAGDIQLAPGDVVFVSQHWAATMSQVLDRIGPLLSIAISGMNAWMLYETVQLRRGN